MSRAITALAALVLLGGLIAVNISNLLEAYGSGPPYYSRSTNMDKWGNPLPFLLGLDLPGLLLVLCLLYWGWRRRP